MAELKLCRYDGHVILECVNDAGRLESDVYQLRLTDGVRHVALNFVDGTSRDVAHDFAMALWEKLNG